jgi:hypothetical protein
MKYEVDGAERSLCEVQGMKAEHPETGTEVARFNKLPGDSGCYIETLTKKILRPCTERTGAHLRSMSVRLPKAPQYDMSIHGGGSNSGSQEN